MLTFLPEYEIIKRKVHMIFIQGNYIQAFKKVNPCPLLVEIVSTE